MIQGRELDGTRQSPEAYVFTASPGYFRVMHIPLLRGRVFEPSDSETAPSVAVVNQIAAERYWREADPVGAMIRTIDVDPGSWIRVVGIVGGVVDVRRDDSTEVPQIYLVSDQRPTANMALVVRAMEDPSSLPGAIRANVAAMDSDLAVDARTMLEIQRELLASANAVIALFLVFAAFALVMASMGIYGVVSYAVSERRHEIGIRMALGASARDVLRMISRQGIRLMLVGGAIGVVGALLVGRLLSSVVIGISTADPLTFLVSAMALALVALAANYVPARRATRIDPVATLRAE